MLGGRPDRRSRPGAAGALESALAAAGRPRAARARRAAVRGPFLPGTPGYNSERLVYNTRYDGVHPQAVVQVLDTRDVQAVVRWANRFGVRVVARSGGHSYAGYSTTAGGVVLDLSRLRGIAVSNGRATVGAGAQLIDVYSKLASRGLLIPARLVPVGRHRGARVGRRPWPRRVGASDSPRTTSPPPRSSPPTAAPATWMPTRTRICTGPAAAAVAATSAIVTSLTFRAHRATGAAWFFIRFPWSQASAALAAWQRFAPHAPPALTSICTLGTTGGSGSPSVTALGQYFGSESAAPPPDRTARACGGRVRVHRRARR